jgi:hypothetical protein
VIVGVTEGVGVGVLNITNISSQWVMSLYGDTSVGGTKVMEI